MSGQDSVRGTFTQRHFAVHDQATGASMFPLEQCVADGARFDAINSPLIEYGVLSFEYGVSLADPDRLVVWEAQFGDFLNGAQIVVDQFIVTAKAKWRMDSSLVISLPHGLEGQGPDHSSARIERILQSAVDDNMYVANPSTPANLFHLLRRQQRGDSRRPLFLISPKSLLRLKACVSKIQDFDDDTEFQPVIETPAPAKTRRIVMCSGKIYYALAQSVEANGPDGIYFVRVEELYPFPEVKIAKILKKHAGVELVWCQEEARNQGAYNHVKDQIAAIAPEQKLWFVGRPRMAAAAGGSIDRHEIEQAALIDLALNGSFDA
jgi:2-oxoglutarate dehydrogenase E1 component